jgi:cytochrome c-type biogenesis protein CcmH/NrfG
MNVDAHDLAAYGWQLLSAGHTRAAVGALQEAIAMGAERPSVFGAYGIALAKANRTQEALLYLRKSLALDATNVALWCATGELSLDRLDYKSALAALRNCLRLDPDAKHPAGIRARALIKRGEKMLRETVRAQ